MEKLLLLAGFIMITLASCSEEKIDPVNEIPVPYWKVGHTWNYVRTNATPMHYDSFIYKLVSITNEQTTFSMQLDNGEQQTIYEFHEDGYLKKFFDSGYRSSADAYLKYENTRVGDRWEDSSHTYEVLSVDKSVTVPAGTFICTKIKAVPHEHNISGSTQPHYGYYSEQYGEIKFEGELLSYELASKSF